MVRLLVWKAVRVPLSRITLNAGAAPRLTIQPGVGASSDVAQGQSRGRRFLGGRQQCY